uniref:Olfactory receptor family 5 subfamily W member 2 n=1 Tax=Pseudonaja textilis TaxID=8673 RepID=A0A670YW12_PSETE
MYKGNQSVITEFILMGFTDNPKMQFTLFIIFFLVYIVTVIGNLGMILLISIAPKMLVDFYAETKKISYNGCMMELLVFALFANVECLLLTLMAYDRYVAICNSLLYSIIMSKRTCQELMTVMCLIGLVNAMINTSCTFRLPFCRSNIINHFFLIFAFGCIEGISIGMILVSYAYILGTVLRMHSAEGRYKEFSTCASHLTAVGIYHGTILFMYFWPSSSYSMDQDKWTSLFYTVMTPMLNPLIYSLRNKESKEMGAHLKICTSFLFKIIY